jgi:hypothetical protein
MDGADYAPPQKRSVLIAGHQTSISLEPRRGSGARSKPRARERGVPGQCAGRIEIDAARLDDRRAAAEPHLVRIGDPPVAQQPLPFRCSGS